MHLRAVDALHHPLLIVIGFLLVIVLLAFVADWFVGFAERDDFRDEFKADRL